jgi:hypothetical protein
MAQFQYTAVNNAGKKLSGVIGAASENEARKQLNTFGISILNIDQTAKTPLKTKTAEPATSSEMDKFEFEAFDKTGQKILGTIPASNRYKAFKRLMDEYEFEVSYVVPAGTSPEAKEAAKKEGLEILKAEYEKQEKTEKKVETQEEAVSEDFEIKRQALLERVDFILEKIKKLLATYDKEINPENKKIVQDYIDKLLRIKSSTNLDYIEHTSEELLKKVQDQELFLHKENMESEQEHVKLQTQQMMATLHSRPEGQKNVTDDIENLQEKLSSSESSFLKGMGQFLSKYIPTPEEKALKLKIKAINKQTWTFRKIWLTAPKETKAEAKESLKEIHKEKDRLKTELKALAGKRHQKIEKEGVEQPLITAEIAGFLGWLLAFYLTVYFFSHYILAKSFPNGNPMPGDFNLLASPILRYLLISIFLWYILLNLRVEYLRYKSWSNGFILPVGIALNAILIFNL